MKQFSGFPARMMFTPIPNLFFSNLLPQINDISELKVTLYIFWLLYAKKGYPRFITHQELLSNKSLMNTLKQGKRPSSEALGDALGVAAKRGTILHLVLDRDGEPEDIYFLNTESDRRAVARIQNGELALTGLKAGRKIRDVGAESLPNIFVLYEENIGMLTPIVAEELKEAEQIYPETWIRDAIKEAAELNKRNWRYITRILENWAAEGGSDGTHRRNIAQTNTEKYDKQRYGHIFRR